MSVRDLFEKRYADAIENLSDDILEIFDYLLDKCEEVEYTRDIQRKRICDLERENNILKNFLFESEVMEEGSDELGDILSDVEALRQKLALLSEISSLADSVLSGCKNLSISTDKLLKQREDCEFSLGVGSRTETLPEEGTYFTDDGIRYKDAEPEITEEPDSPYTEEFSPIKEAEDAALDAVTSEEPTFSHKADTEEATDADTDVLEDHPENTVSRVQTKPKKVKRSTDDEISDITSRLRSMLDEGEVKKSKSSSDDDGYSDLVRLFFKDDN